MTGLCIEAEVKGEKGRVTSGKIPGRDCSAISPLFLFLFLWFYSALQFPLHVKEKGERTK
jgi:hypothetical protein